MLHLIAKQASTSPERYWQRPNPKKLLNKTGLQQELLSRIPRVGKQSARALLDRFGTLQAIISAPECDLRQVAGVGRKRASSIYQVLHESALRGQVDKS